MKKIIDLIKSLFDSSKPAEAVVELQKVEAIAEVVVAKKEKKAPAKKAAAKKAPAKKSTKKAK